MSTPLNRRHFLAAGAATVLPITAGRAATQTLTQPVTQSNAPASGAAAEKLVRLSANENPYGPGPAARAAIASATNEACRYDSGDMQRLIAAVAAKEQVDKDRIVLGCGSGELLNMLAFTYCERGQLVCAWPTFGQITAFAEKLGCEIRRIPLNADLQHDLSALSAAITANTSLVYICNPNNPSSTVVDGAALREFCTRQAAQTLVVVDEAYLDLVDDGATESMIDLVRGGANVVVLRTFSKIHGLAGLRIGYAVARADVAARLRRNQMALPSIIGTRAAFASLGDQEYLKRTRSALLADRRRLCAACDELQLRYAKPQGNFLYVHVGMPADEFAQRMKAHQIQVGRVFEPLTDWCRITVGTSAETTACIAAIRAIVKT